jgi:hypothetical protein
MTGSYKGSSWISVDAELPPATFKEVEIAFWDGVAMCRAFGCYHEGAWWSGGDELEGSGIVVTHWRKPAYLPKAPQPTGDAT